MNMSLAYWYVALAAMLAEINYASDQLDLQLKRLVLAAEIDKPFVGSPRVLGFRGSIVTEGYFFGFGEKGIFCIRKNILGKNNLGCHGLRNNLCVYAYDNESCQSNSGTNGNRGRMAESI